MRSSTSVVSSSCGPVRVIAETPFRQALTKAARPQPLTDLKSNLFKISENTSGGSQSERLRPFDVSREHEPLATPSDTQDIDKLE
jgi:hypothetical protein